MRIYVTRVLSLFAVLALIAAGVSIATAAADNAAADAAAKHEKQVDIKDIPAAAKAAIEKEVGDGTVTKVLEGSDEDGGKATYYEAKYTAGEKKLKVKVGVDGTLISKGDDTE